MISNSYKMNVKIYYLIVWDICNGESMDSKTVFVKLLPRRFASFKSLPDKLHC